jgi:hypothetical protein
LTQAAWQPPPASEQDAETVWHLIRLRCDGQAPLRFEGRLLARHDGLEATALVWHEIALYHVATGGYAVQITAHLRSAADTAAEVVCCHAALLPTLETAVAALEQHDAAHAAMPGRTVPSLDVCDQAVSPTNLLLQATRLAALQRDIVERYRVSVGALLFNLAGATQTNAGI